MKSVALPLRKVEYMKIIRPMSCGRELLFDLIHGSRTFVWKKLCDLEVVGDNKQHGQEHQPTSGSIRELFRDIGVPLNGRFLDIGCGKGKVLIEAALYGFRDVVGVDFSQVLVESSRSNLKRLLRNRDVIFNVVIADAANCEIPCDVTAVCMFNPFDAHIMSAVLTRLEDSFFKHPRQICVIYSNPKCSDIFEE